MKTFMFDIACVVLVCIGIKDLADGYVMACIGNMIIVFGYITVRKDIKRREERK